jgi:hypothetical protein
MCYSLGILTKLKIMSPESSKDLESILFGNETKKQLREIRSSDKVAIFGKIETEASNWAIAEQIARMALRKQKPSNEHPSVEQVSEVVDIILKNYPTEKLLNNELLKITASEAARAKEQKVKPESNPLAPTIDTPKSDPKLVDDEGYIPTMKGGHTPSGIATVAGRNFSAGHSILDETLKAGGNILTPGTGAFEAHKGESGLELDLPPEAKPAKPRRTA